MADGLRIVTFNMLPQVYSLLAAWAAQHGHRLILLVTSPVGAERYGSNLGRFIESIPPSQDILITSRMRQVATPVIAALAPDLILVATFPHRLPPALVAIPRYGALNLHPSPLPRGRGPNPQRLLYEGDPTIAGTLHRVVPEFDAGPILSQQQRPVPDDLSPGALFSAWAELLLAALEEGVPRAVAGEVGETQDETLATYAAPFTEEERWLDWNDPARLLQQRVVALNLATSAARAIIDGAPVPIVSIQPLPGPAPDVPPGAILDRVDNRFLIRAADGLVEVITADG